MGNSVDVEIRNLSERRHMIRTLPRQALSERRQKWTRCYDIILWPQYSRQEAIGHTADALGCAFDFFWK